MVHSNKTYTLLFVILFLLIVLSFIAIVHDLKGPNLNQYKTITVKEGDSLWSISDKYKGRMTSSQFVSWVEKENQLTDYNYIQQGQEIVIPVKQDTNAQINHQHQQLADGMTN